ncbi:hypothetical protein E3N88_03828 [Mikania micrantha]|uniref:Retrotransposon gag domain-containing protein n=1 Tax=Mikania micrantha TaxID=192012 RepID=A0A5N6PVH9_9ASTR|nr:hypothetical protein E3N88_03828 [Mikania micrantha]
MDPPTSTTGQATPSTPSPNLTTNPTSTFEVPPTNTTPLATTQSERGNLGPQGGLGYQQSQPLEQFNEVIRQPTGVQPIHPQGPQFQRSTPLQTVQPHFRQPQGQQFQRPVQQQAPPPPQYQHFAPQEPIQGQAGRPRVPLGAPRRHHRELMRGIDAHFRPVITNNPSPVVIPHHPDGRTFEVRTNALQSLPKYKGLATEEPYFHLETYDSICNTIGGQGFSSDDVKLVLFPFSLEDKAKQWFHTLSSASIYTWADMQQKVLGGAFHSSKD